MHSSKATYNIVACIWSNLRFSVLLNIIIMNTTLTFTLFFQQAATVLLILSARGLNKYMIDFSSELQRLR